MPFLRHASLALSMFAWLCAAGVVHGADTWYVATNGNHSSGNSWTNAYTNLATALSVAGNGDTICLAGHTFVTTYETVWTNRNLSIQGGYEGTGTPGNRNPLQWRTIIRQPSGFSSSVRLFQLKTVTNGTLEGVTLHGGRLDKASGACLYINAGSNIVLRGVTLQNGYGYSGNGGSIYGAGIYASSTKALSVLSCVVQSNTCSINAADVRGAGIYLGSVSPCLVSNTVIRANGISPAGWLGPIAGGVCVEGGTVTFRDCVILGNYTTGSGGATYGAGFYSTSGSHTLRNCLVVLNSVSGGTGDGVYVGGGSVRIENCTVTENFGQGIQRAGSATVIVTNSIAWNNGDDISGSMALAYSSIEDGDSVGTNGCIAADPQFTRGYYLAGGSLCRDAGGTNASAVGLAAWTTQTNAASDSGIVDLGYHYSAAFTSAVADLYVSPSGGDGLAGTNWVTALRTVTKALAKALDGTHIHLAAGQYTASDGEVMPLTIQERSGIQLLGVHATNTIVSRAGGPNYRVLSLVMAGGDTRIENITIRDGYSGFSGGGVSMTRASATLSGCDLINNTASVNNGSYGGGLYANPASLVLTDCIFTNNQAYSDWDSQGGGLYVGGDSWFRATRCVFFRNYTREYNPQEGGGIMVAGGAAPSLLRNCLIARNYTINSTLAGAGYYQNAGDVTFEFCTVAGHAASEGLYRAGGTIGRISHSVFWDNTDDVRDVSPAAFSYCDIRDGDGISSNGCFSVNPRFTGTNFYHVVSKGQTYANGFFARGRWQQGATNSVLIDAGNPLESYASEPQPNGRRVNLGAYGNTPVASTTFLEDPGIYTQLTVHAYAASALGTNYGTLSGEVLHTGGAANPRVHVCWGDNDGGLATQTWDHVVDQGVREPWDLFSSVVTNLQSQIYYYRCRATNAAGTDWSELVVFEPSGRSSVTNTGARAVRRRTARLTGLITSTGGDSPSVWFRYWPDAGGTTTVSMGIQSAGFTNVVGGLSGSTLYHYSILASNRAGLSFSRTSDFTTVASPATWYVATNGTAFSATNWATAFRKIQDALNTAETGDTICVAGHTFVLTTQLVWTVSGVGLYGGYEGMGDPGNRDPTVWPTILTRNLVFTTRLLLMSRVRDAVLDGVVLEKGYLVQNSGANLHVDRCTNVILRTVTVRQGTGSSGNGGIVRGAGLYTYNSTGLLFTGCSIVSNTHSVNACTSEGVGFYVTGTHATFTNCDIAFNKQIPAGYMGGAGAGGVVINGGVQLVRCVIRNNIMQAWGAPYAYAGGLYIGAGSHCVRSCVIATNDVLGAGTANMGDGVYSAGTPLRIENTTVARNRGEGVYGGSGTTTVTNSILWANGDDVVGTVALGYSCIEDGDNNGNNGCVLLDPLFADITYYHLLSRAGYYTNGFFSGGGWVRERVATNTSPLIDKGDPATPWAAEPSPNGHRVNMGAYGGTDVASKKWVIPGAVLVIR